MTYCDSCGQSNRDGARFCRACGAALDPAEPSDSTLTSPLPPSGVPEMLRHALAGQFEVRSLLGRGGMGAVYAGRELALDRPVAIKVLPDEVAAERSAVERFQREARLAARLRHPNIVAIHAVGERGGIHFFTMDLVEGETLERHVAARRAAGSCLLTAEARAILLPIARAVGHAHRHGVVHRDLKPSNVMVGPDGQVVVMDFGLAREQGGSELTSSGAVVGTPRYMSPEQAEGRPATPRSDLYALGLIHYFLLTGKDLVQGPSVGAVVAQHLTADLKARVAATPGMSPEERAMIVALIERDPALRPESAEAAVAMLAGESTAQARQGLPPVEAAGTVELSPRPSPSPASPVRRKARERLKGLLEQLPKPGEGE